MSDRAITIRVMPWGQGQGDFVEINADDFDPAVHTIYQEGGDQADNAQSVEPKPRGRVPKVK